MELIAKISKGSKMDQVYIPKNRSILAVGDYVVIRPLESKQLTEKPYFYNLLKIEPIKVEIVNKIFNAIEKLINYQNIIITGSFLDDGFKFNDIDILIITDEKQELKLIKKKLNEIIGIDLHLISIDNKSLMTGLETDPLYQMMLSKFISKKKVIYNYKNKIMYKILDLHLLKSRVLIDNFSALNGNEKYYLTRNMISIYLYLNNKKIDKEKADSEIKKTFSLKSINEIKDNLLDEKHFIKQYSLMYNKLFKRILEGIKSESEQKKING